MDATLECQVKAFVTNVWGQVRCRAEVWFHIIIFTSNFTVNYLFTSSKVSLMEGFDGIHHSRIAVPRRSRSVSL